MLGRVESRAGWSCETLQPFRAVTSDHSVITASEKHGIGAQCRLWTSIASDEKIPFSGRSTRVSTRKSLDTPELRYMGTIWDIGIKFPDRDVCIGMAVPASSTDVKIGIFRLIGELV